MPKSKREEDLDETSPPSLLTITWPSIPVIQSDPTASTVVGEAELVWNAKDESITIDDRAIAEPLLYTSNDAASIPEASCINTDLSLEKTDPAEDPELGYWPQYANLSPAQRNHYVEWLASGRQNPLTDYGYLFLFFFGLERRMLLDGGDAEPILRELLKLRKRYADSDAFYNTSTHFMAFVFATVNIRRIRRRWFDRLYVRPETELHEDSLVVALTWLYERKEPMLGAIAFQVALKDTRCSDSVVVRKAGPAFRALFLERYEAAFPEGMLLKITEQKRAFAYRPVNPTLQGWRTNQTLQSIHLADVLGASDQFTPLVEIWNECITTLRPKISTQDASDWDEWKSLLSSNSDKRGDVCTTVENILTTFDIKPAYRTSLSMEQSLDLIVNANAAGISIEPLPDAIFRPYRKDDVVAIVPINGQPDLDAENLYLAAALLLGLGIGMAAVDSEIDELELLHLPAIANARFHFGDDDRKRITAYGNLLLEQPPKLVPIAKRLSRDLKKQECLQLAEFLIGITASNAVVEPAELEAIAAVYRAFGLPEKQMKASLNRLGIEITTKREPGPRTIDQDTLNTYLAGLGTVAATIGDAYRRIRRERKRHGSPKKTKNKFPAPGTTTLSLDAEFHLSNQHANYDDDTTDANYRLRTAPDEFDPSITGREKN
jgi:uncharacterized tellurite resistance protein B-like protein